jgi:hypothetical protein
MDGPGSISQILATRRAKRFFGAPGLARRPVLQPGRAPARQGLCLALYPAWPWLQGTPGEGGAVDREGGTTPAPFFLLRRGFIYSKVYFFF